MEALKKEILELLEKDLEFRYAVAGYLGLSEVLKRLDAIAEEQVKLREEQSKIWEELVAIKEEQVRLSEEQVSLREEQVKLGEEQVRLREEQNKILLEIAAIKEEQVKFRQEQINLREDFNKMLGEIQKINVRLGRVERTLEKLTLDIEDEARSVIKHKIKEMGITMDISSLTLPDVELNLYGVNEDTCLIGEATVRAGAKLADELLEKLEKLRKNHPEKLRSKLILVIYTSLPMEELIEEAKAKNIWLLKATEEFHRPEKLFRSLNLKHHLKV
ncbi:MAG: hypothetical protein ACP5JW_03930 [Candidatus Bathyarchaeia archaeon]